MDEVEHDPEDPADAGNDPRSRRLADLRMRRLAQLGGLLAGFAHEVRNPLSTIGLNLQLVLEDFEQVETQRDKRTKKRLGVVEQEVRRLQHILDEFLAFARAPEPRLGPLDVNEKLRRLVEFLTPEIEEEGLVLRFYADPGIGLVEADWDHLQAAVVNLVRNAREATPRGGQILIDTSREGQEIRIRVTDTGPGIPEEARGSILEPYFSTKKGGTGLGLPTVRRIAEEHGGRLTFETEPGRGTQFTLHLRAHSGDPPPNA